MIGELRTTRPLHVLMIDDSEPDVVLTIEAFEDAKIAVTFMVAKDGPAAIALLDDVVKGARPAPELILLDLNLPKIDGLGVLEHIKADPILRVIPVIVLTSSRSPIDHQRTYQGGANSFISKPMDPEEFLRIVRGIGDYWVSLVRLPSR